MRPDPSWPPHMCLLHETVHPLAASCLAAAIDHSLQHPVPFSREAWHDYMWRTEQALLDRHIREHRGLPQHELPAYEPDHARPRGHMGRAA